MDFYCVSKKTNEFLYTGLYAEEEYAFGKKVKFSTEVKSEQEALSLFYLLGFIEEKGIKQADIYHLCDELDWGFTPQISAVRERAERLKRKGFNLHYYHSGIEKGHEKAYEILRSYSVQGKCPGCEKRLEQVDKVYKGFDKLRYICRECNQNKVFVHDYKLDVEVVSKTVVRKLLKEKSAVHLKGNLYQRSEKEIECSICKHKKRESLFSKFQHVCFECCETKTILVKDYKLVTVLEPDSIPFLLENPMIRHMGDKVYGANVAKSDVSSVLDSIRNKRHATQKCCFCQKDKPFWEYSRRNSKSKTRHEFCVQCENSKAILLDNQGNVIKELITAEEVKVCRKSKQIQNKTNTLYKSTTTKKKTLTIIQAAEKTKAAKKKKKAVPSGLYKCVLCTKRKEESKMSLNASKKVRNWCKSCEAKAKEDNRYIYSDYTGTFLGILAKKEAVKKEKMKDHHFSGNILIRERDIEDLITPKIKNKLLSLNLDKTVLPEQEKIAVMTPQKKVFAYIEPLTAELLLKTKGYEKKCEGTLIATEMKETAMIGSTWLNIAGFKKRSDIPILFRYQSVLLTIKESTSPFYITSKLAKKLVSEGMARSNGWKKIELKYDLQEFREELFKQTNCAYCPKTGSTVEHIRPRSRGGITSMKNCIPACQECNSTKGDFTLKEILRLKMAQ